MALGDLVVRLSADLVEFRSDMGKAVATTQQSMSKIEGAISDTQRNIGQTLRGAVAAFGAVEIAQFTGRIISATAALDDMSEKTGASVESLSALRRVANVSGQNFDTVGSALTKLAKNLAGVDDESKGAGKALEAIGLNLDKVKSLSADQQLQTIAKAMNEFADGTGKAAASQVIFGKAGAELLPYLKDLADAGEINATVTAEQAAAAEKLEKAFNSLKADLSETATVISSDVLPLLQLMVEGFSNTAKATASLDAGFSPVKETLRALIVVASEVAFVFKGVGTEIGGIAAQLAALSSGNFSGFAAIRDAMVADAEAARKAQDEYVAGVMGMGTATAAAATVVEQQKPKLNFSSVSESTKTAKKDVDELGAALNKIFAKQTGFDADYLKTVGTLSQLLDGTAAGAAKFTEALFALNSQQKVFKDASEAAIKAEKDWADAVDAATKAARDSISAQYDRAIAAEAELDTYGLTKSAIEETIIARLEEQRRMADGIDGQEAVVANLEKEIAARKRVAAALRGTEAKDAAKKAAEDSAKAWEKFSDDIERSLTDALMRGFEAGNGFGETFVNTLKNTLKTAALKIVVQAIIDPIMGNLKGGGGIGSLVSGGGGIGNLLNFSKTPALDAFQSLANSNIGKSIFTTESPLGGPMLTEFGSGVSQFAEVVDTYGGYVSAAMQLADGQYGAAAGAALGQYLGGPIGSFIGSQIGGMIDDAFGGGGGPKQEGGFTNIANDTTISGALNDLAKATATSIETAFEGVARRYGVNIDARSGALVSTDPQGTAQTMLDAQLRGADGQLLYSRNQQYGTIENVGRSPEELTAAIADTTRDAVLTAVAKTDIGGEAVVALFDQFESGLVDLSAERADVLVAALAGGWLNELVESFGDAGATLETVADSAKKLLYIIELKPILEAVGISFLKLGADVVAAFGGVEQAGAALSYFYENFYTAEEKRATLSEKVAAEFDRLGVAMPESIEGFRDLVDAQDLATESGRKMYASLLNVAPGFKSVTDASEKALKDLAEEWTGFDAKGLGKLIMDAALNRDVGESAAAEFASALQESVRNALVGSVVDDISKSIYEAIVLPMVAGEVVSKATIASVTATAQAAINALGDVLKNLDLSAIISAVPDLSSLIAPKPEKQTSAADLQREQQSAAEKALDTATAKLGLLAEIYKLNGDAAGAAAVQEQQRALALQQLEPELRDFQVELWGLQDAAEASAKAADILGQKLSLQAEIYKLTGDTVAAAAVLEQQRALALAALAPELRALQTELWDLQDAATLMSETMSVATDRVNRAVDAALAGVRRAVDAEKKLVESDRVAQLAALDTQEQSWQDVISTATKAADSIASLVDSLADGARNLRGGIDEAGSLAGARALIDSAISTGNISDPDALKRAISTVQTDTTATYATRQEFAFAQAVQAGKLDTLGSLAGEQLATQEDLIDVARLELRAIEDQRDRINELADAQLASLDQQILDAQRQVDALRGIDTSVLSVRDAITALGSAITTAQRVIPQQPSNSIRPATPTAANAINAAFQTYLEREPEAAGLAYWTSQAAAGMPIDDIVWNIANSAEAQVNQLFDGLLGRDPEAGGLAYWTDQLNAGVSLTAVTEAIKDSEEYKRINGFAVGTSFVPQDMVANIHKGEIIVDPASSAILRRYGIGLSVDSDPALLAEVRALREELRAGQGAIASNTRQTKDLLDSVVNGGNTVRTEVIV